MQALKEAGRLDNMEFRVARLDADIEAIGCGMDEALQVENGVMRLKLAVIDQTVRYRAEVLTIDGASVLNVDWLSGPPYNVDVSASLLKSGKYRIRLSDARDGAKKEVASYYFWVR